jgi:hypothetical protein
VTEYTTAHDRDLHLIVARSDGSRFQPRAPGAGCESTGTWSLPWEWAEAGTYRVFADFTPAGADAPGLTLSRTVQVAGAFAPVVAPEPTQGRTRSTASRSRSTATWSAGSAERPRAHRDEVTERPVTALEPYLGAFGHLVALRDGDLAFLHVHADGRRAARQGETAGPEIVFAAEAPTAGRYLLYLDFQVDGRGAHGRVRGRRRHTARRRCGRRRAIAHSDDASLTVEPRLHCSPSLQSSATVKRRKST